MNFDPDNPRSPDAAALNHTAVLLAALPAFWAISETNALTAPEKIIVGIHAEPWDEGRYTKDELAQLFCEAQIYPPVPSESVAQQDNGGPEALVGGVYELFIRRYVRPIECQTHADRSSLFLGFYDHICWLKKDLLDQAEKQPCPRLTAVQPVCEAAFGLLAESSGQGNYLWSKHRIFWGDLEQ